MMVLKWESDTTLPPPRVLHVGKDFSGTGAPRVALQILQRIGFASRHYVADERGDVKWSFIAALRSCDTEALWLPGLANRTVYKLPAAIIGLVGLVRARNIDVVHSHAFVAGIAARFAGCLVGIPVVHTVHNLPSKERAFIRILIIAVERLLMRISTLVVFVNDSHRCEVTPKRLAVLSRTIPNFIPELKFSSPRRCVRNLLFIGRFEYQKNPQLFVSIAAESQRRRLPFRFRMVGDGPLRAALVEQAAQMKAQVEIMEFAHDPSAHFDWADCVTVTSRYETFSLVIAEGLAAGCHVVCTDVDNLPEIWGNAVRFVKAGDVRAYCDTLQTLANESPPNRGELPSDLTEMNFTRRYSQVYMDAVGGRRIKKYSRF